MLDTMFNILVNGILTPLTMMNGGGMTLGWIILLKIRGAIDK